MKYARQGAAEAERKASYAAGQAAGAVQQATPSDKPPAEERLNDPALARKVESEIFRAEDAPKGAVAVNVEDGVVFLRGEVADDATIRQLAEGGGEGRRGARRGEPAAQCGGHQLGDPSSLDANLCSCRVRATILHADLDAFYASVEQRDEPRLRGRPVIVGAGVVLAASYEAKAEGVRTAMGGAQARRLCPEAAVVSPRMSAYSEASDAVYEIFRETTPLVEGLSIDEAFLDVRGLGRISGTPLELARRLRRQVAERLGLPITVGIATTKFLAKVASAVAKPDGLLLVPPGASSTSCIRSRWSGWGVGPVTSRKLRQVGITTVAEVARLGERNLVTLLGRASGRHLHALAHGRDPRRVQVGRRRRSIGSQRAMGRRMPRSWEARDAVLVAVVDRLGKRLRAAGRVCRTVTLRLRFDDFSRATRSHTLVEATNSTQVILATARDLFAEAAPLIDEQGLTLIGISLGNLEDDAAVQLVLPFARGRSLQLDAVVDQVRDRFGSEAITRAVLLGRDQGLAVPLLPD